MKMVVDSPYFPLAISNLELFCDVKIMLSMVCLTLMLTTINSLVKFAQLHNIFVCDFVAKMKISKMLLQVVCGACYGFQ
jgi:hypothetical protein